MNDEGLADKMESLIGDGQDRLQNSTQEKLSPEADRQTLDLEARLIQAHEIRLKRFMDAKDRLMTALKASLRPEEIKRDFELVALDRLNLMIRSFLRYTSGLMSVDDFEAKNRDLFAHFVQNSPKENLENAILKVIENIRDWDQRIRNINQKNLNVTKNLANPFATDVIEGLDKLLNLIRVTDWTPLPPGLIERVEGCRSLWFLSQ